jgi:hypothetical protein
MAANSVQQPMNTVQKIGSVCSKILTIAFMIYLEGRLQLTIGTKPTYPGTL